MLHRLRVVCLVLLCLFPTVAGAQVVVAPGPGMPPFVRVMHADGTDTTFLAYDGRFGGGVRLALGDVNGDGILDIITGAGPGGGPHVKVFSGVDFSELASFFAYSPMFVGGVYVAAGDVNGDGRADIITGAGFGGGPHVRVFSGADLSDLASFFAYSPVFVGGVHVAAGDVNGDGRADIITGAGFGGGPHVRVFSGADLSDLASFFAYSSSFVGGVSVASADINGDGNADIITGAGPGGGPHVRVFSGTDLAELHSFFAYDSTFVGGVFVGAVDFDGDGQPELVTGAGPGGGPHVKVLNATDLSVMASGLVFDPGFTGGVFVGSVAGGAGGVRITSANAATFPIGSPGTFTVTTAGGSGVPTLTSTGTLPDGVTFTDNGDGTATLAGTPGAGSAGTYPLTFTASDGVGAPATQNFTLTVTQAPAITSAPAATFNVGFPGSFTVTTTGSPTPAITATGMLPAGVTFVDNGDGTATLAGTPAAGTADVYPLTIGAANGVGAPATQSFTLTISEGPVITSPASTTFTVGVLGTFTVTTIGSPTPTLNVTGTLPPNVSFLDNGNGTGTLSGTPAAGTAGTHTFTITATNSAGTTPQLFTLHVHEAPVITSGAATTFTVGTPGSFTVTTTGFPPPAIAVGGTLPAGVTFVDNGDGTGTLSGTPDPGTGGAYGITFTATNAAGSSAPQAFLLTVNQAPAITSANATTFTVGSAGSFTITTTGFPPPAIAIGGATLPAGVTFTDNGGGTGTLAGTPDPGTGGTYAITFTATNTAGSSPEQTFTLTVNQAPAITSAAATTFNVGTPGSFTITTAGFPAPAVSLTSGSLPSGLTLVDNGDGTATLSGTPAAGTAGPYPLQFTAANGVTPNAVQDFALTITDGPAITSANTTTFTVGVNGTFTVTTTGSPAPTLGVSGTLPANVAFVDNGDGTGTLSGTPNAGTGGAYPLVITATNSGGTAMQNFTLTVNQAPAITSANATAFTEGVAGSFTITTTAFPTATVAHTGALPSGVTFTANPDGTATLAGTPAAGSAGTYPLIFSADNGVGTPATQNFTLTIIDPRPVITAGGTLTFTEGNAPTAIDATITVADADSPNIAFASAQITGNYANGQDVLAFPGGFGISSIFNPTTGTLTLSGSQPVANYQAALRTVTYFNGSDNPSSLPRTVTWTVNDGTHASLGATSTINVIPVNDGPIVVNETFDVLGNTELRVDMTAGTTPHTTETTSNPSTVKGVLDNDADPESDPITVTAITGCADATAPFDCTLPDGAVIHVEATGEFSFTPGAGDTTASFTYTVTDTPAFGLAASVQGTVTFTIVEMVWYVKNDAPAGGTGTSIAPLNALTTLNGVGGAGDVDDANDYVFVYFGDGNNTGQTGGLELEAGQHLLGEFTGLSIPVNLNGNGSPTVLVPTPAGDACSGGPCRPLVSNTTGNAVTITEAMVAEVRGFRLAGGSAGNAIDVTTDAPLTGSSSLLISANVFQGAGQEGLDVTMNAGTTGTLALNVTANSWNTAGTHAGFAADVVRLAGTLHLDFSGNTDILSTGVGAVVINGGAGGAGSTFITGFANNSVHGNTAGGGIGIMNATFDATPGGAVNQVNAGTLAIGASGNPVGVAGISIGSAGNPALGNVSFTDFDVFATTFGLMANGTGGPLTLAVTAGVGTISAPGGAAVDLTAAAIDLQLSSLTSTVAAGSGVTLTNVSGTFSAPSGSTITKSGGSGAAFSIDNGAITTALSSTYGGTISNTSGIGGAVLVNSADAGSAVSFTGAITETAGTGISLTSNTGATMSFSGGLTLNGASTRFSATGGGTVTVTGTNTIGATTAPAVTALNVTNTTIGASRLLFRSISSNGGSANGIILDNTGSSGGLTVDGDGANTAVGGNASGGTITGKTGADGSATTGSGIYLNATSSVILRRMTINGTNQNFGIRGINVNGFTMEFTTVTGSNGNNAGIDEGSVNFDNLTGAAAITSSIVEGGFEDNLNVVNTSGTLNRLVITGSTFGFNNTVNGNNNILIESQNPGTTLNFTIQSSTIKGARADWINASNNSTSTMDVVIGGSGLGNTFDNLGANAHAGAAAGGNRVVLGSIGTMTFDVNNNTLKGSKGEAIRVRSTATLSVTGTATGHVRNNVIGVAGTANSGSSEGSGIFAFGDGGSDMTIAITGNTVHQYNNHGIRMDFGDEITDGSVFNATVTGNTVNTPGNINTDFNAIHLNNGTVGATDNFTSCVSIGGAGALANNVSGGGSGTIPPNNTDIRLRQRQSTTVRLPGYAGANNDDAAVVAYLTGRNILTTAAASNTVPTGGGFIGGAACIVP
jgi:hypothetical protein